MWLENALENYKKNAIKTFQMKPLHLNPTQIEKLTFKPTFGINNSLKLSEFINDLFQFQ